MIHNYSLLLITGINKLDFQNRRQALAEKLATQGPILGKEVCNRGVACSLLKLGSLEKTVIASLFPSGLHTIFFGLIFFRSGAK
jgi:hypothetical protein